MSKRLNTEEMRAAIAGGKKLIVAYGGGRNSTAMLVRMADLGIVPEAILFANTGGEKPETYAFLDVFSAWLESKGMPRITIIRRQQTEKAPYETLEEECLKSGTLPSIAYGFKGCSEKWKVRSQKAWVRANIEGGPANIVKAIGYHAGEERRANNADNIQEGFDRWFPLLEWDLDSDGCKEVIAAAGLPDPGKSACFFCPSSKKEEILELAEKHPDLMQRALLMEEIAAPNLTSVKGLGRRFAWKDVVSGVLPLNCVPNVPEQPCGCFDSDD
jgi:hypothetical protein